MGSATIEKIHAVRVATISEGGVMIALDGQEDARIIAELPRDIATKLTMDLLAAGYGPTPRGGRA